MRVLMIAPQPFFEPRGVPFSVYYHVKALTEMGHRVDLLTYPIGSPVALPGLTLYRAPALPFIREVKVGPSLAKIVLDLFVFFCALGRLCRRRYRWICTHEEAGAMGLLLAALFRCRHLYFAHSDLAQQTASSDFTHNRFLLRAIRSVQKRIVRSADAVVAICPDIATSMRALAPQKPIHMIENVAVDEALPPASKVRIARLRAALGLGDGPVLLYTGTLEPYQGLDLLLQSAAIVREARPDVSYVIVGGRQEQVERLRELARRLDVLDCVHFVAQRPFEEMPDYMALADVLVSPRCKGTNTPLKLYTYLRSGKPVLATAIFSHTQVLSPETALLVAPSAEGLARGALALLADPTFAWALGQAGRRFAEEHFSWPAFLAKNRQLYREMASL